MNNFTDSDSPHTDHACVAVGGVGAGGASSSSSSSLTGTRNPRKKRTKMMMTIMEERSAGARAKPYKRPDPDAPKITRPCTECGKKFWSWKALFGHMRCHPERQWRGINPPPNLLRRPITHPQTEQQQQDHMMTDKDHEVAECLLLLASGKEKVRVNQHGYGSECPSHLHHHEEHFECSSCKKVFGSHQALGGHRASHKSVKGCFAITADHGPTDDHFNINMSSMNIHAGAGNTNTTIGDDGGGGHKCSICLRVFSTGQALGGHKRCHWERADTDTSMVQPVDLNLPPPAPLEDHCSSSSSPPTLDLRLGL